MPQSPTHEAIHDTKTARHRFDGPSASVHIHLLGILTLVLWAGLRLRSHAARVPEQIQRVPERIQRVPGQARDLVRNLPTTLPALARSLSGRRRLMVAAGVLTCLTLTVVGPTVRPTTATGSTPLAGGSQAQSGLAAGIVDSLTQSQADSTSGSAQPTTTAPVDGLTQAQMDNAQAIVEAGQAMGLPQRAFVIAVATALQESNLYNLASSKIPESYQYDAEGSGSDHDSLGLFQQRPSSGWGKVAQLMNPTYAAQAFYKALVKVSGWASLPLAVAAQKVQVSAYPSYYAKHETQAQDIVDALVA